MHNSYHGNVAGSKLKLDTAAEAPVDLAESITSFVECFAGETVGAIVGDIVGASPKPSAECVKVESDRNRSTLAQVRCDIQMIKTEAEYQMTNDAGHSRKVVRGNN